MLVMALVVSCSTTPSLSSENAHSIYEQAKFAFPLSFSEHLPMSGKEYAETIESYTRALRNLNLAYTPSSFQSAFHSYIQAWGNARAVALAHPNDTFVRARNGETVILAGPQADTQSNPSAKSLYDPPNAYSADFIRVDREIEKWSRRVQALARK